MTTEKIAQERKYASIQPTVAVLIEDRVMITGKVFAEGSKWVEEYKFST